MSYLNAKKSEEERLREINIKQRSTCYRTAVERTPDNKKRSMRDFEYLIQHDSSKQDNRGAQQ